MTPEQMAVEVRRTELRDLVAMKLAHVLGPRNVRRQSARYAIEAEVVHLIENILIERGLEL